MRHAVAAVLAAALVSLAACGSAESGSTSIPRAHVVAGIDSDALSEGERLYLDDVLEKAPVTTSGAEWKASVTSAAKGDLDMLFDGERLDFCNGAPRRDKTSFTAERGEDEGAFAFVRQEAARKHLC